MKKNFIAVFPVIVFAVLSVFGQQTQTKLYFSSTQEAGVTVDLANLSIWKVASPDGSFQIFHSGTNEIGRASCRERV